jgi:hypothetical protein
MYVVSSFLSRNTLDLWLKREKETGDYQSKANSTKGRNPKIQDREKFREFVREHSDKTQKQIAQLWGLEKNLIPQLKPGDIIILDNASFHKGESIREIVEEAGCELWYLPAYSPDLNKIENWWSVLKTWMKQRLKEFETVRDCVDAAFKNCPNVFA